MEEILVCEKAGKVAILTLNRIEKRNSLSIELLAALERAMHELAADREVRTMVLRGAGEKVFCAGFDIGAVISESQAAQSADYGVTDPLSRTLAAVAAYPYPTVAMLNGAAYGGGVELALACDLRVAADDISIAMPPVRFGIVYSWTGLRRFVQAIGVSKTKEMFFTGRRYAARELKDMGLIDHVVPRADLQGFTRALAAEMAGHAPLALRGTKRTLNLLSSSLALDEAGRQEACGLAEVAFRSEDLREGLCAFSERRKPDFKGR